MVKFIIKKYEAQSEFYHQSKVIEYANYNFILKDNLISIPNDGKSSAISGKIKNLLGRKKGASDLFLILPNKKYHGFFIEMKKFYSLNSRKRITEVREEQKIFLKKRREKGYAGDVAFGFLECIDLLNEYINDKYEPRYQL